MKSIGILKCDSVNEKLKSHFPDYDEMFYNLFQKYSNEKLNFNYYDLLKNQFPKSIDDCFLYIITGSQYACYDQKSWIDKLKNLVKEFFIKKKKLLGICFGHQIMAESLGGKVDKSANGWGLGLQSYTIYEGKEFSLFASHQDQVIKLPTKAKLMGGNSFCPNGLFKVEDYFLSLQAHPEFSMEYSKCLLEIRKEKNKIPEEVYQKALLSYSTKEVNLYWTMNLIFDFFKLKFKSKIT